MLAPLALIVELIFNAPAAVNVRIPPVSSVIGAATVIGAPGAMLMNDSLLPVVIGLSMVKLDPVAITPVPPVTLLIAACAAVELSESARN